MKKYLFWGCCVLLFILILFFFYDKKNYVVNKVWDEENIHIEYPLFKKKNIDRYISDYIGNIIYYSDYRYKYYVNYYLGIKGSDARLVIYVDRYFNNVYSYNNDCFVIDIDGDEIEKISCNN